MRSKRRRTARGTSPVATTSSHRLCRAGNRSKPGSPGRRSTAPGSRTGTGGLRCRRSPWQGTGWRPGVRAAGSRSPRRCSAGRPRVACPRRVGLALVARLLVDGLEFEGCGRAVRPEGRQGSSAFPSGIARQRGRQGRRHLHPGPRPVRVRGQGFGSAGGHDAPDCRHCGDTTMPAEVCPVTCAPTRDPADPPPPTPHGAPGPAGAGSSGSCGMAERIMATNSGLASRPPSGPGPRGAGMR